MFSLIVVLFIAGLCLFLAEVLVPGWVLGIMGVLTMLVAVALTFIEYGLAIGTLVLCGVTVLCAGGFFLWMKIFPQTVLGKMLVNRSVAGEPDEVEGDRLSPGLEGVALTDLRPAGTARFANRRVDVVSEAQFINKDEKICITLIEGPRVVVRPLASFEG